MASLLSTSLDTESQMVEICGDWLLSNMSILLVPPLLPLMNDRLNELDNNERKCKATSL